MFKSTLIKQQESFDKICGLSSIAAASHYVTCSNPGIFDNATVRNGKISLTSQQNLQVWLE